MQKLVVFNFFQNFTRYILIIHELKFCCAKTFWIEIKQLIVYCLSRDLFQEFLCRVSTFSAVESTRKIFDILMRAHRSLHYTTIYIYLQIDSSGPNFPYTPPSFRRMQYLRKGRDDEDVRFELQDGMRPPSISELTSALSYLKGNSRATD